MPTQSEEGRVIRTFMRSKRQTGIDESKQTVRGYPDCANIIASSYIVYREPSGPPPRVVAFVVFIYCREPFYCNNNIYHLLITFTPYTAIEYGILAHWYFKSIKYTNILVFCKQIRVKPCGEQWRLQCTEAYKFSIYQQLSSYYHRKIETEALSEYIVSLQSQSGCKTLLTIITCIIPDHRRLYLDSNQAFSAKLNAFTEWKIAPQ